MWLRLTMYKGEPIYFGTVLVACFPWAILNLVNNLLVSKILNVDDILKLLKTDDELNYLVPAE